MSDPLGLLVTTRSSIRIYACGLRSTFIPQLRQHREEMVATAASATLPNVVGLIGTKAGLNVQIAAMRMKWCADQRSSNRLLTFSCHCLLSFSNLASIGSTRRMHHSSRMYTYCISPRSAIPYLILQWPCGEYHPSLQHPRSPKPSRGFNRARACAGPPNPTTLP
jgi:hypothetical protein